MNCLKSRLVLGVAFLFVAALSLSGCEENPASPSAIAARQAQIRQEPPGVVGFYARSAVLVALDILVPAGQTLSCDSGDAVTGWTCAGCDVGGNIWLGTTLNIAGTLPTGIDFSLQTRTRPGPGLPPISATVSLICADLAP